MGTTYKVPELPNCDFCKEAGLTVTAHYDGKTIYGPWAYMCTLHFKLRGTGLGTGVGQQLILKEKD